MMVFFIYLLFVGFCLQGFRLPLDVLQRLLHMFVALLSFLAKCYWNHFMDGKKLKKKPMESAQCSTCIRSYYYKHWRNGNLSNLTLGLIQSNHNNDYFRVWDWIDLVKDLLWVLRQTEILSSCIRDLGQP